MILHLIQSIIQNKAKVTEEVIDSFMDSSRKIDPTIGRPAQPLPQAAPAPAPAGGEALAPSEPGAAPGATGN